MTSNDSNPNLPCGELGNVLLSGNEAPGFLPSNHNFYIHPQYLNSYNHPAQREIFCPPCTSRRTMTDAFPPWIPTERKERSIDQISSTPAPELRPLISSQLQRSPLILRKTDLSLQFGLLYQHNYHPITSWASTRTKTRLTRGSSTSLL